jgi:hypothetical protein
MQLPKYKDVEIVTVVGRGNANVTEQNAERLFVMKFSSKSSTHFRPNR